MFLSEVGGRLRAEPRRRQQRLRRVARRYGRFMQPDPLGYEAGTNLYAYVGNDPINATDPSGLTPTQLICTGTRICPQHDSGGSGGAGGSKDSSNGKDNGSGHGGSSRFPDLSQGGSTQLFGNRSWGGFGGSTRYQCVQRCGSPTSGVDEGNGDIGVYAAAEYDWVGIDGSIQLAAAPANDNWSPDADACYRAKNICVANSNSLKYDRLEQIRRVHQCRIAAGYCEAQVKRNSKLGIIWYPDGTIVFVIGGKATIVKKGPR